MDALCKMYVSFWVTEGSSFEMLKMGGSDISNDTAIRVISTLMQSVRIMQVRIVNSGKEITFLCMCMSTGFDSSICLAIDVQRSLRSQT